MGKDLAAALDGLRCLPGRELSGIAVDVVKDGKVAFSYCSGSGRFGRPGANGGGLPVDGNTMWRVASLSKPVTALGAWKLSKAGLLDLDADISDFVGYTLRNPQYPDSRITARMLLGHTSSLRDSDFYYPPLTHSVADLLLPGGRHYRRGCHFAAPLSGRDTAPGKFYAYCNLGYAVLGGAIERLTGLRFDIFMRDEILAPLSLSAGYNPSLLSDRDFPNLSPLYRKCPPDTEEWNPAGPWFAQIDDFRGEKPRLPVRLPKGGRDIGYFEKYLENYRLGENGSLFSPQGGLRAKALDLCALLPELARYRGEVEPVWERSESPENCDDPRGLVLATAPGLMLGENPRKEAPMWGHHGDAYGFLGGMFFTPKGDGYVYQIGGVGANPERNLGEKTKLYVWEEKIMELVEAEYF